MHIKIQSMCIEKAKAWIDLQPSTEPCELFDDSSKSLGHRQITIVSLNHGIIGNRDYRMYPKTYISNGEEKLFVDENCKVTIFLSISSDLRSSNIWS